jgi:hypothetical protein
MLMTMKFTLDIKFIHLSIIVAVLIYTVIISAILTSKYEPFFFEVSPGRKACLEKQVSLTDDNNTLYATSGTCDGCCAKGTKGGIPARYNEYGLLLGNPEIVKQENNDSENWIRNDLFQFCH